MRRSSMSSRVSRRGLLHLDDLFADHVLVDSTGAQLQGTRYQHAGVIPLGEIVAVPAIGIRTLFLQIAYAFPCLEIRSTTVVITRPGTGFHLFPFPVPFLLCH